MAEEQAAMLINEVAGCLRLPQPAARKAALEDLVRHAYDSGQWDWAKVYLGRLSVGMDTWPDDQLRLTLEALQAENAKRMERNNPKQKGRR
jgi:hypothetical protein